MLVRWCSKNRTAKIFNNDIMHLCEFPSVRTLDSLDNQLLVFNMKRKSEWKDIGCGQFEAHIEGEL